MTVPAVSRCRICTANDRAALIDQLAAELWDSRRYGTLDDRPFIKAGDHWQRVFRGFAETAIELLERAPRPSRQVGLPNIKSLSDLRRISADLRVTCAGCGRSCIYATEEVIAYFFARSWNTAWETVGGRFRCDCCGRRGAVLGVVPKHRPDAPRPPAPIAKGRRPTRR